jgi:hypothetical protein
MGENVYVFVVCGAKGHIDTLHFSLRYLKCFSENKIFIVTDSSRNEVPVFHEDIIDIKTPEYFTNHQASIYLKTGLHKFLPKGNNYCYLDTDVLALNNDCDKIFTEFITPITFAPDHFSIQKFSMHAIKCNCEVIIPQKTNLIAEFLKKNEHKINYNQSNAWGQKELDTVFSQTNSNNLRKFFIKLLFASPLSKVWINQSYYFDKKEKSWKNQNHEIIMYHTGIEEHAKSLGLYFSKQKNKCLNQFGNDFWLLECNHLIDAIKIDLGITVEDSCWQHWNGGVFLFNNDSHEFLERWHQLTLKTFNLKNWKTRDQGTLIATVWNFKLQNHPVLDKKWNFLADDNNPRLDFNHDGFFTENAWQTKHKVNFVHVYHRFGDKSWDLWNYIESIKIDE